MKVTTLDEKSIKEILHEKRKTTEYHIKQLQHEGKQGIRYTAMMPDIPFLILGLMSDIGWLTHLIASFIFAETAFVMCWTMRRSLRWQASCSGLYI